MGETDPTHPEKGQADGPGRPERQAEEARRKAESILNATQRLTKVGGWEYDVATGEMFWTGEVYRIHGLAPEAVTDPLDQSLQCYRPEDRPVIRSAFQEAIEQGKPYDLEFPFTSARNECLWIRTMAEPILHEGEVVSVVGNIMDITAQKKMERQRVHLERLSAQREISMGLSHNLNNILTGVQLPAETIQLLTDDADVCQQAELIEESARRAATLVSRLHQATRSSEGQENLEPVAANEIVQRVVQEWYTAWKETVARTGIDIDVVCDLEEVPLLQGAAYRFRDILVNLLTNAAEAMPEGGAVTIRTRVVEGDIRLAVSDTGRGMDEETRWRVFEPFFTTKADVGSGLGLSMLYGTVTQWGGSVDVESAPGKGATFILQFPAWIEEEEAAPPAAVGKLLIIEDDAVVRRIFSDLLSREYEVDCAEDGREALANFVPGRYDLALIDLALPGMPGDQVAKSMKQQDPALATVLVSGLILDDDDPRLSVFDFWLQKPLSLKEVQDTVVRVIESRRSNLSQGEIG